MPFLERLVRGEALEAAKDSAINLAVTRGRWDPLPTCLDGSTSRDRRRPLAPPRGRDREPVPLGGLGERAPLAAEISRHLREGQRIQYSVGRDAALAGHLDAPVHVVELSN